MKNMNVSAMALLNYARQYHEAAEILFDNKPGLTRVINFLYFHTVELLLKSYLKASGKKASGHSIAALHKEAQRLGLKIQHDQLGLQNIVGLLESGNKGSAFRYFTLKSGNEPDLNWTREIVKELMDIVKPFVESKFDTSSAGVPVKLMIKWSKPK